jgi:hypothetical protein
LTTTTDGRKTVPQDTQRQAQHGDGDEVGVFRKLLNSPQKIIKKSLHQNTAGYSRNWDAIYGRP